MLNKDTIKFNGIPSFKDWKEISLVDKGWSPDQKYHILTNNKEELLLRVSDISLMERRKKEYEELLKLKSLNIVMTDPHEFGVFNEGKQVYTLLSWVKGEEARELLPQLSLDEQYCLGVEAGNILKKIHSIPAPKNQRDWSERFNQKITRNIGMAINCEIKIQNLDKYIDFIESNRFLLENRPQTFQHGDYHVGNMIITSDKHLGIIDFNRLDYGDPWEEFNRIIWCVDVSPSFATGIINGYFDNDVPNEFFRLMALYLASNQLASVPWAMSFGDEEVNTMIRQAKNIFDWYDHFRSFIPNWYQSQSKRRV